MKIVVRRIKLPPKPWVALGPIEHLQEGWALIPFHGERAHHWKEFVPQASVLPKIAQGGRVRYYDAACGMHGVTTGRVPAIDPGNWPRCANCTRELARRTT